jgi:hypothetical protein
MKTFGTDTDQWTEIISADVSHIELDDVGALIARHDLPEYDPLESPAVESFSENHKLSKIVIDMAQKTKHLMEDDEGPRFARIDERVEDEQVEDEETSRPPSSLKFRDDEEESLPFEKNDWFTKYTE